MLTYAWLKSLPQKALLPGGILSFFLSHFCLFEPEKPEWGAGLQLNLEIVIVCLIDLTFWVLYKYSNVPVDHSAVTKSFQATKVMACFTPKPLKGGRGGEVTIGNKPTKVLYFKLL